MPKAVTVPQRYHPAFRALTKRERQKVLAEHRGLLRAIAEDLQCSKPLVSRVFSGHQNSERVARAIDASLVALGVL